MPSLSIKARKLKKSLSEEKFRDMQFQLLEALEKDRLSGLEFDRFQVKAEKTHEKILIALKKFLDKTPSPPRRKAVYLRLINFFLDEAISYYGSDISMMTEEKVLDFLFDRFPRKYPGPSKEKKLGVRVLIFLYKALLQWKLIPEDLYLFVKKLKDEESFFITHTLNYSGSGFFWDKDEDWVNEYEEWLIKKGLAYPVYPEDIPPLPYVGPLENDLVRRIDQHLAIERRNLQKQVQNKLRTITKHLIAELNRWYSTPQDVLQGLTPRDAILLERLFVSDKVKGL
ncbi:MAG: hypothetical protein ACE5R6_21125 [Candidatus Heimdallarchaeota archaeon]